jgi:hypothetical protein
MADDPGFEPGQAFPSPGPEPGVLPVTPVVIEPVQADRECGRRESNAHSARFEFARSADCRHARMVRRQGLEPRTS